MSTSADLELVVSGAPLVRALAIPPPTIQNLQLVGGECRLFGWSFYVPGANTARFALYNGSDITGTMVAYMLAATLTATTQWLGPNGVYCDSGLFLNAQISVTATGVVYVAY